MKGKIASDIMKTWTDPYVQFEDVVKGSLEDYVSNLSLDDHPRNPLS